MTLSTDLVIIEPVNPRKVFDFALSLLSEGYPGEPTWEHVRKGEGKYPASTSHYSTTCGQGLAAWLFVHYADDGPLSLDDEVVPPHCVRIDWDTAYGFRGQNGEGCGDLHARMVATVGHWLDEQGLTWWWHDECEDGWHRGYEGLERLASSGAQAQAWFTSIVAPAIDLLAGKGAEGA